MKEQGGWYYIGHFTSSGVADFKTDLKLEFVGHSYYGDNNSDQDSTIVLRFKTGTQSSSTFLGNAQAYKIGKQQYSPEDIRIVQDGVTPNMFKFYAFYRPYAEGSFVIATSPSPFTFIGSFSPLAPSGSNFITVPIYNIFTSESGVAISDVSNLSTALSAKADYNAANLPNFHNKQDIEDMFGDYYTRTEIDSAIDQKFTF